MAGDPNAVLRSTGTIYFQVLNLTAAPYGGFEVGFFENGELIVDEDNEDVVSESLGKRIGKLVAETVIGFEFDLVQFNPLAFQYLWDLSGSLNTTLREPSISGTHPPGTQGTGFPVLFVAADPAHPSILAFAPVFVHVHKRIPWGDMERKRRERIRMDFCAAGNGKTYMCDTINNLSLS